jgi:hypothetical protein
MFGMSDEGFRSVESTPNNANLLPTAITFSTYFDLTCTMTQAKLKQKDLYYFDLVVFQVRSSFVRKYT